MRFELYVARRYLTRRRKNAFLSLITVVSIIGVAIGVAALVVALALIGGYQRDIRSKILETTSHLMVTGLLEQGGPDYRSVAEELKALPGVLDVSAVVHGTVLIRHGRQAGGGILRGVDAGTLNRRWKPLLKKGEIPEQPREVVVGAELADQLSLQPGDRCQAVVPQAELGPMGALPRLIPLRVSGIFRSGLYELDNATILGGLTDMAGLLRTRGRIHYLQVYLQDPFQASALAQRLRETLPPGLGVVTWQDLNATLYSAMKLEKTVLFFTLCLIILVASLNIVAGLVLLVMQKIKDIGILLTYGASDATIRRIFFLQGAFIGLSGTALGLLLGAGFVFLANHFELIRIPAEIYQTDHLPFHMALRDLVWITVASLAITFTATLWPSRRAAGVSVVEAVKNE